MAPFFNEARSIGAFVESLKAALSPIHGFQFEIICVDDGSTDDTLSRLLDVQKADPRFRVIELSRNFGKEAALSAGLEASRGDAVIPIDADLQDPPQLIERLLSEWSGGTRADVVLAHRSDRSTDSAMKRMSAHAFYRVHNHMSRTQLPSDVGDFRLMDRRVVDVVNALPENQRFMKGLFAWVGFRTVTVDYTREQRVAGQSTFNARRLLNFAFDGIASFSSAPLRLWIYVGSIGALASMAYALLIAILSLTGRIDVPGYASMVVAILLMGSLELLSIGMVGDFVARVFVEAKRRPAYIIRKIYEDEHGT